MTVSGRRTIAATWSWAITPVPTRPTRTGVAAASPRSPRAVSITARDRSRARDLAGRPPVGLAGPRRDRLVGGDVDPHDALRAGVLGADEGHQLLAIRGGARRRPA